MSSSFFYMAAADVEEEMEIPAKQVGKLIGPGGSTIQSLEHESSASISVSREESDGDTKKVQLKCKASNVAKAKELITA